ncbi:MAG: flagellar motor switch protein FliG [Alphaproteobacteria bacterium]
MAAAHYRSLETYEKLTGPDRVAILMLALGDEHVSKLFTEMQDEEIREISQHMASLGAVASEVVEQLFKDFAQGLMSSGALMGTYDSTERLLSKILPDKRVEQIMEEIRGPAGRTMWEKLANVNETVLANYLKNEYPQTVAVVLSKVRADHASRVLTNLPEGFAMEVVMRMLRMESVQKEVLDDVEKTLRNEFMSNLARTNRRDAHEMMADIFNNLDRSTESRFLSALEERNRDAAEKIKSLMFTFEDLGKLDATSVQKLMSKVPKDKLAMCLKGASESLRQLFVGNMSERAAKLMKEDMVAMGPVRLKDVDEAQSQMIAIAKDLAASGEIVINEGKGEDELVY